MLVLSSHETRLYQRLKGNDGVAGGTLARFNERRLVQDARVELQLLVSAMMSQHVKNIADYLQRTYGR